MIILKSCILEIIITQCIFIILEVRQEAVQQALAAMQSRPKPSLPMPSKRTSVMAKSPDRSATTRNETGEQIYLLLYYIIITFIITVDILYYIIRRGERLL